MSEKFVLLIVLPERKGFIFFNDLLTPRWPPLLTFHFVHILKINTYKCVSEII